MTTKLQNYIQLAGQTAAQVTKNPQNWAGFLNTVSNVYRYTFPDQLMIHSQRPKATACAEFDLWTRRMNRHIRRGSKGIGLIAINRNGYPKIRYVFDIGDTELKRNSASLFQWRYKQEYRGIVTKALEEQFGVSGEKGLVYQLEMIAVKMANDYWKNYHKDIMYECEGSFLEELEEPEVSVEFRMTVAASISYVLLARCGFQPEKYLKSKDFQYIPDFNTQRIIRVLGAAVSEYSEQALRTIAVTIYNYEHQILVQKPDETKADVVQEDATKEPDTAESVQEDATKESAIVENTQEDATEEPESANTEAIQEDAAKEPDIVEATNTENSIQDNSESEPASQEPQPVNYQVGDTVYLEDTAYEITKIDMYDVQLRDPSQRYPIFRVESKDRLNDMLQHDSRNAKQPTPDTEEPVPTLDTEVVQDTSDIQEVSVPVPCNFTITDERLGEGGPKTKFQMNIKAIRTLKQIESEGRTATFDEQQILSKYVGWGGVPDAFEPDKAGWEKEYQELKAALTPEEYTSAKASVLNAHYTSPVVIKAMYQAVGSMGFTSGKILEPACGVGNFFGLLPEEMSESKLYGVELDGISGRIAKLLYPNAQIHITGYEKAGFPDDFFDLAIGNVPFGQYQVNDPEYNKLGFSIHNYFLAKSLDKVRPGGILAFITTRYTMDSKDTDVREYLAARADLLGAVRLPDNAFKANANTEVVSDILFLQKRDTPADEIPDWVHTEENADGFIINNYFLNHPEMVLGTPSSESTQYGRQDYTVMPIPGANLTSQLKKAMFFIRGAYQKAMPAEPDKNTPADTLPSDDNVKNYSFTLVDGEVYYRENSCMKKAELNTTAENRVKGMMNLRDCVHRLIALQMDEYIPDSAIKAGQAELNQLYDAFTHKYGLINSRANRLAFERDSSYYLLCSLEILDDDGRLERKADMFTKRTIKQHKTITSVDTASEALVVSIGERAKVDLKDAFKDWIFKEPERRQTLVHHYNETMNNTRPREYDGSHIVFSGINPEIKLQPHQFNAIAHVLYGGNTLLAHEVGAGKTFEMIAAAMESKRLGLCHKSIFVGPNHLTEQTAAEFLRLYPAANILVTTKKDFETRNRKKFCARIATSDMDAVIIGHSQFERIPISMERQERLIREQIDEITDGIREVKASNGERFTVKQLERTKKSLEVRLEKLQANNRKDDVVTFEQLGVDMMFVDESDLYKNLFLYTKMRNVAGLSTADAQKSSDMFAKCRYLDEITGGRGIVFATGTPISNSMTEMYSIQRYLQYDRLQEMGMGQFDSWASRFGETTTALELAPEGTGYRARTRFAKFFNLPELMNMFKEIADIKTADQLNLPTPEVEYHNIVSEPTEFQQAMVKELSKRAEKWVRGPTYRTGLSHYTTWIAPGAPVT